MTAGLSRAWIAPLLALLALFALATWVSTSFTILDADVIACSVACALLVAPLAAVALRTRRFAVLSALVVAVFAVALVVVLRSRDNVVGSTKDVLWALGGAALFAIVAPAAVGASPRRAAVIVLVTAPLVAIPTTPTIFFWVAPLALVVAGGVVFGEIALERRNKVVPSDEVPTASRPRLVAIAISVVVIASVLGVVAAFVTAPAVSTPAAIRSFYGKGTTYRLESTSVPDLPIYWVRTTEPRYQSRNVGWDRSRRVVVTGKDVFLRLSHDDADRAAADAIEWLVENHEAFVVPNRTKRSGNEVSFVYTTYPSRRGHATTVDLGTGALGPETIVPVDDIGSMGTPVTHVGRNTYRGY
jgi:hypothetical protein